LQQPTQNPTANTSVVKYDTVLMSVVSRAIELLQEEGIGSLYCSPAKVGSFVNLFPVFGRYTMFSSGTVTRF